MEKKALGTLAAATVVVAVAVATVASAVIGPTRLAEAIAVAVAAGANPAVPADSWVE